MKLVKLQNLLPCKRALSSVTCDVTNSTHSQALCATFTAVALRTKSAREHCRERERGEWESDRQAGHILVSASSSVLAFIFRPMRVRVDDGGAQQQQQRINGTKRTKDETTAKK